MTLVEFLLARIAEDEADWKSSSAKYTVHHPDCDYPGDMPGRCDCNLLPRLLAECEAKRRVIALASEAWDGSDCTECNEAGYMGDDLLRLLALPFADHPDFREEWRP